MDKQETLNQQASTAEVRSFWRSFVFSQDHKVIGIQYGVSGLHALRFWVDAHQLFLDGLADIYNAEQQLAKALPKIRQVRAERGPPPGD